MKPHVNVDELRNSVRAIYHEVAVKPEGDFHFAVGRSLAETLGYPSDDLDRVPAASTASFAGVGYHFELADARDGEHVLDLGSGSGMDSFLAATKVGPTGRVVGIDMTNEQLERAESLRRQHAFENVTFVRGYLEDLPFEDGRFDLAISNGVINLVADKERAFREIARVLRPGGRMAISDIVTESELTEEITCDASLWAACIGGAAQQDSYRSTIEAMRLEVRAIRENAQYRFLSKSAQNASRQFGVKSISLLAVRT